MAWRFDGRLAGRMLPLLLLAAAAVRIERSPRSASNLHVTPDSVEYAVCAQRFATLGRYDVEIEGVSLPPHSPPWFSVLVLSPAYRVAPRELGAGIVPVLLFSLAGVLAAFRIGRRLAGDWGGAAAVVAITADRVYRPWSREIMTDVPAAALGLWGCAWFLRMERESSARSRDWAVAGILTAAASAMRSEYLAMILPFAWIAVRRRRERLARLGALLAPAVLVAIATALYNRATFGEWRRTGYQFWTPIPWDDPSSMFSWGHLRANLENLAGPWALPAIAIGALGTLILFVRRSDGVRPALTFLVLAALPGTVAHLFFFHVDIRFHLFALSMLGTIGAAGLAELVPESLRRAAWVGPLVLAPAVVALSREPDPVPVRRIVAETLARVTPTDAVIVTGLDPVYLEPLLVRGTRRRIVPVSRDVEFASKAVAWKRIPGIEVPSRGPYDHRTPGLFRGGAVDVVAFTADERPEKLAEWVRAGVPVYVDRSFLPRKFPLERARELGLELALDPERPWLGRLVATR